MSMAAVEGWIIRAMDVYDKQGLYPGCSIFAQVQNFATEITDATHSEMLEAVSGVLKLFVRGLSGRGLRLEAGDVAYTDTDMLYLPARLSGFARREDNYRLYKALTAHGWAQTWYGNFRLPEDELLSTHFAAFPDPDKAQRLFHALETARLDACLARDLPGLYRDMQELQTLAGGWQAPAGWTLPLKRLQKPVPVCTTAWRSWPSSMPASCRHHAVTRAGRSSSMSRRHCTSVSRARSTPSVRRSPTSARKQPPGMRWRASRSNTNLTPRSPGLSFHAHARRPAGGTAGRCARTHGFHPPGPRPDSRRVSRCRRRRRLPAREHGRQTPRGCLERHLPRRRRVSVQRVGPQARALSQALVRAARARCASDA